MSEHTKERTTQYYACEHGIPGGCQFCNATKHQTLEAERDLLKSQVAELAEALKPFAKLADDADAYRHEDDSTCHWRLKALDLRQARAALAKVGP